VVVGSTGTPAREEIEEKRMSLYYATISALIFAIVAVVHLVRLFRGWKVEIGSRSIPMSVSWAGLIISALLALWGFQQLSY
jgi:uncharacterized membrane protein YecN with MAPEG domain